METDSITVVLFRSEMSLTEVPEARNVLRQWARASQAEQVEDVLSWRQRLGYRDDWLASTEQDRQHILHRLLCAIWNGQADIVEGDADSPRRVRIRLYEEEGPHVPGMTLRLDEYRDEISGWAGLLRSYERWALLDEGSIVEDYCGVLMRVQPKSLGLSGSEPDPLYVQLVHKVAPHQLKILEERERLYGPRSTQWIRPLRQFWSETLQGALDIEFTDKGAFQPTLRTLEAAMGQQPDGGGAHSAAEPPPGAQRAQRREEEDDWGTRPLHSAQPDREGGPGPAPDHSDGPGQGPARPGRSDRPEPPAPSDPAHRAGRSPHHAAPDRDRPAPEDGDGPHWTPEDPGKRTPAADPFAGGTAGGSRSGRPAQDDYPWEDGGRDDPPPPPANPYGRPTPEPSPQALGGASSPEPPSPVYPPYRADADDTQDGWPGEDHDLPWTAGSGGTDGDGPQASGGADEDRTTRNPWEREPE